MSRASSLLSIIARQVTSNGNCSLWPNVSNCPESWCHDMHEGKGDSCITWVVSSPAGHLVEDCQYCVLSWCSHQPNRKLTSALTCGTKIHPTGQVAHSGARGGQINQSSYHTRPGSIWWQESWQVSSYCSLDYLIDACIIHWSQKPDQLLDNDWIR